VAILVSIKCSYLHIDFGSNIVIYGNVKEWRKAALFGS
jgi:hypothetical protein